MRVQSEGQERVESEKDSCKRRDRELCARGVFFLLALPHDSQESTTCTVERKDRDQRSIFLKTNLGIRRRY